jgi:hypothetical protein
MKKKPPDIKKQNLFRTIKCPLEAVLKQYDEIQPKIERVVIDINQLVILANQFIKAFLINLFNSQKQFPTIDKDFIKDVLRVVGYTKNKRKPSKNTKNLQLKEQIKKFYDNSFQFDVSQAPKISYTNKGETPLKPI